MSEVEYVARDLMHYSDNRNTNFIYSISIQIDGLYHFSFIGQNSLSFYIYAKTNTLYLNGTNFLSLPSNIENIIQDDHHTYNFTVTRKRFTKKEIHGGEDSMKKQSDDASSILDDRDKLKIKIREDVDTLSKDIAKKHSLDRTHSQVDKITKRIMKSLH